MPNILFAGKPVGNNAQEPVGKVQIRWRRPFRLAIGLNVFFALLVTLTILGMRGASALQAQGDIYTFDTVPNRPVALVFGAEIYPNSTPSPMLADRVAAAARLYRAGKVKALLFSGDNHVANYNEPEAMREYAITLGVPDNAIVLDYAGFRTYDSCYRARAIFKVTSAILVTQAFHLDRALLICKSLGITSIGMAADTMRPEGYDHRSLVFSELREIPATVLSIYDLLREKKPYYLGDPLPIFGQSLFLSQP